MNEKIGNTSDKEIGKISVVVTVNEYNDDDLPIYEATAEQLTAWHEKGERHLPLWQYLTAEHLYFYSKICCDYRLFNVGYNCADVANALGYANPRDALAKHVDSEDKRASQIATPSGIQTMTVINESGVYSLILRSNLPKAKEFKRWVTSVVLPSIRKHGVFEEHFASFQLDETHYYRLQFDVTDTMPIDPNAGRLLPRLHEITDKIFRSLKIEYRLVVNKIPCD